MTGPRRAAQPGSRRAGPRSATGLLEAAMRLDNDQTVLDPACSRSSRASLAPRRSPGSGVEGLEHIPRTGAVILAVNHISNADPVVAGAWITAALAAPPDPLAGQARAVRLAGLRLAGGARRRPPGGPRHGGRRGLPPRDADPRGRLRPAHLPGGHAQPHRRARRRRRTASAMLAMRTGAQIVPDRRQQQRRGLAEGPASCPRRSRAGRSRCGSGSRSASPTSCPAGTDRRAAKTLATTAIMGRIAALLEPRHRGVYAGAVRAGAPRPNPDRTVHASGAIAARVRTSDGYGHGRRKSESPTAPGSATASARPSTRPRSRRPRASRRIPSARSSTTRASSATSQQFGVQSVDSLDDVDHGSAVVIRAHGVKPEVFERAESRGLDVIDGTCTWVIQEQRQLQAARGRGLHHRPPRDAEAPRGRRPARLRARTRSSWTRRRTGTASRAASGWRSSPSPPSRPGSSRSWRRSWSAAPTSSRS